MRIELTCVAEIYAHPDHTAMAEEYAELAMPDMPKPMYDQVNYDNMERSGVLTAYRAMYEDNMIGFMGVVQAPVPHYGAVCCVVESLFVRKAYRKTFAGMGLIRAAERQTRYAEAAGTIINCPYAELALQELLQVMGYRPVTLSYFKPLAK